MVWLPMAMAAFALLVAVGASALSLHSPTARAEADLPGVREGTAPWLVELMRSNQHAHSQAQQAVSGAYHDASRRADACSEELRAAVADLARAESRAQTCDRDLLARDEYLKAAAPEAELKEAQEQLVRVEAYFGAAAMAEAGLRAPSRLGRTGGSREEQEAEAGGAPLRRPRSVAGHREVLLLRGEAL
ncbi:hypothetical protein EMIHUDRAFT_236986 [Emiliania huxleyi CCMP1516]|uniref:Uncharacterized protein n=2 Tax=Emiliania huxleyi TaxID=2903 RepID=A0A0D3IGR4_EMIH1|nr:hypothetical protein EMIHUDRAFT_215657 [Emiliania huxleyi CCMP1516]XP_005778609.1 hypothetical protein EMIHUDRAFT_236986 [Emiliania huxleyi CCMP1516]EOD10449.1 hypothetical protein EMIHUDRAFT_215657 [Emiliania huxleyi CCMP1516]EOD26180.1 hypothetical protein EMIHUDRAFT_236986 [Emiliania huxleyi CCMP1516]|eukprot:XP_005762878.1 hypothetical protein EMIHUDRAFT_215657 [Emiliania huxleyi CCMP1516]